MNTIDPQYVAPQPPAPKKSHKGLIIGGILVAVGLLAIIVTLIVVAAIGGAVNNSIKQGDSAIATTTHVPYTEPGVQSPVPANNHVLTSKDVALTLKIKSKECYGYGVGCNVEYQVRASWTKGLVAEDSAWDVSYTVTGSIAGPILGTLTLSGDGTYYIDENMVSTKSKSTVLKVKIVGIEKNGL